MGYHSSLFSSGPLNFDPEEFHSDSFSVDEFIQRKRYESVPLDVLREDLGSHLKTLRSSLIELINQDYSQFVNLSSNLVGLDGRIQSIVGPLGRAKIDIQGVDELLEKNITALKNLLDRRRGAREAKTQIQYLRMAASAVAVSEKLMRKVPGEIVSSMDFNLLRGACDEVSETKFLLECCAKCPLQEELQEKWKSLCKDVLKILNDLLKIYGNVDIVNSGQEPGDSLNVMKSLVYMYTELQCEEVVKDVLVAEVLLPKIETVLAKKGNIGALFECVELFLSQSSLILLWKNLEYSWMASYNFIEKGIFPTVLVVLSKHFPHIWSPSNPDLFHSNWKRCEEFIRKLEHEMPSLDHLESFRSSAAFIEFNSKWQFSVYFQLRFHSIANELESSLEDVCTPCATNEFNLDATRVMIHVLNRCWDKETIYISKISGRFLKASALVVSRYIQEVQSKIAASKTSSIRISISAYCDLKLSELVVTQILSEKLKNEFGMSVGSEDTLTDSTLQFFSGFSWQNVREAVENHLVEVVVSQSTNSISAVNEVPRLYRRTNRDTPTNHLEYVEAIIAPLVSLKNDVCNAHQMDLWNKIGNTIGAKILQRYKLQVQEVLASVQRMEESLRRLKKVKGQNQNSNVDSKGNTDDDKIRLQIQLDVNYFVQKLEEISPAVDASEIQSLFVK